MCIRVRAYECVIVSAGLFGAASFILHNVFAHLPFCLNIKAARCSCTNMCNAYVMCVYRCCVLMCVCVCEYVVHHFKLRSVLAYLPYC